VTGDHHELLLRVLHLEDARVGTGRSPQKEGRSAAALFVG
jgi:hypothetical protein